MPNDPYDDGLRPVDQAPSGGTRPVSVTIHRDLVSPLGNQTADSISGLERL